MTKSILEFFPYDTPRPSQIKVLKWIEKNWNRYDVFVLSAPVACGKSAIAITISRWANSMHGAQCSITTPDNVLVGQYKRDFKLHTLPTRPSFASGDLFKLAKQRFKDRPIKLMNNYTLLANRVYSEVQIMDEAHELIPMLQDFEGIKIWQHLNCYPSNLNTSAEVLLWAASLEKDDKVGKKVRKLLSKNPDDYVIVHEEALYRGKPRNCLRIYPLTPKNNAPILWPPSKVKKLFLMSATIAKPDVEDLGLHTRRVGFIEVPSDIPVENRPLYYVGQGSMGRAGQSGNLTTATRKINDIHKSSNGRGFVHSTYSLAGRMRTDYAEDHLIFHSAFDKQDSLNAWLSDTSNRNTFVGCGLTTGLDLKGDKATWQCILKCQFPDLEDPAIKAKAARNPEWYAWTTIKQIIQAYGRVCRSPDDYGVTYILDSDFTIVYNDRYRHLFPRWFTEAIAL